MHPNTNKLLIDSLLAPNPLLGSAMRHDQVSSHRDTTPQVANSSMPVGGGPYARPLHRVIDQLTVTLVKVAVDSTELVCEVTASPTYTVVFMVIDWLPIRVQVVPLADR